MPSIELRDLSKAFDHAVALDGLDLTLSEGELVALLGPSGCGKTTALRIVAGFEMADRGSVRLDGVDISGIPAHRRDMGMVFQSYSLFPHLTVGDNVAFGLRMRGRRRDERRRRAHNALSLVGLVELTGRFPHQLSGGQQQRTALARALAVDPAILLLDEPLSALDAKVRVGLRDEIRQLQQRLGITTLFVTHDQEEAMAVADRVGVMSNGRLEQIGTPHQIYQQPASGFVARFVGTSSVLPVTVRQGVAHVAGRPVAVPVPSGLADGMATLVVRPEAVVLSTAGAGLPAMVSGQSFRGPTTRLTLRVEACEVPLQADVASAEAAAWPAGTAVVVGLRPAGAFVLPPDV